MYKRCVDCKQEKEISLFHKGANRCKPCAVEATRQWRIINPGKRTDRGAEWYAKIREKDKSRCKIYRQKNKDIIYKKTSEYLRKNKEKTKLYLRKSRLKTQYGLTLEQFASMLEAQNGRCAICSSDKPSTRKIVTSFAVDHCHKTGKIRGLLCSECNTSIGKLKEDPVILRRAAEYLER